MQTLLQAVGLVNSPRSPRSVAGQASGAGHQAGLATSRAYGSDATGQSEEHVGVTDLKKVEAATAKTIIHLEEQAKSLGKIQMTEASALLDQWIEGLKRKPRADEPLASFKASFLRSRALQKSLESLRRNELASGMPTPELKLPPEMTNLLQLCMPKGAAPLAQHLLDAIVGGEVPAECLLKVVQVLKEDWQRVVWDQEIRFLERNLNSIEYELDKAKIGRDGGGPAAAAPAAPAVSHVMQYPASEHEQQLSQQKVTLIAKLCEVTSTLRGQVQKRSKEVSEALQKAGVDLARWLGDSPPVDNASGCSEPARSPEKADSAPPLDEAIATLDSKEITSNDKAAGETGNTSGDVNGLELQDDAAAENADNHREMAARGGTGDTDPELEPEHEGLSNSDGAISGDTGSAAGKPSDLPSRADCESAFDSMSSKDIEGMRNGLRLLGLPELPLEYVPGSELRLGGHDIRDAINRMWAHWNFQEDHEFEEAFLEVRRILKTAPPLGSTPVPPRTVTASSSSSLEVAKEDIDANVDAMEVVGVITPNEDQDHQCKRSSGSPGAATGGHHAEVEVFYVSETDVAQLHAERADIVEEQQILIERLEKDLERLKALSDKLAHVDARLGPHLPWEIKHSAIAATSVVDKVQSHLHQSSSIKPKTIALGEQTCSPPSAAPNAVTPRSPGESSTIQQKREAASETSQVLVRQLLEKLQSVSEVLAHDSERVLDRMTTTLQQRRARLLESFAYHLHGGVHIVQTEKTGEALESLWQRAQELCIYVESAVGGGHTRISLRAPDVGARCRAKWAGDGCLYDAEVQNVLADGTVVVNWLRPRPDTWSDLSEGSHKPPNRPLFTVSEHGGDDSCHRWVPQEEVHVLAMVAGEHTPVVQSFLGDRPDKDRICIDCNSGESQWASISFGIYLCGNCTDSHHRTFAPNSPLRRLDDIWSWCQEDLTYMQVGGNTAFREVFENYPDIATGPYQLRYQSRFGEYYRRRLESLTLGLPPPAMPLADEAAQKPKPTHDFLSGPEARQYALEAIRKFEAWYSKARTQIMRPAPKADTQSPPGAVSSQTRPARQQLRLDGTLGCRSLTFGGTSEIDARPRDYQLRS